MNDSNFRVFLHSRPHLVALEIKIEGELRVYQMDAETARSLSDQLIRTAHDAYRDRAKEWRVCASDPPQPKPFWAK